jgi:hypothetical protein
MLEDAYRKGQDAKDQARRDVETGRDRVSDQFGSSDTGMTGAHAGTSAGTSAGTYEPATTQSMGTTDGRTGPVR